MRRCVVYSDGSCSYQGMPEGFKDAARNVVEKKHKIRHVSMRGELSIELLICAQG